MNRPLRGLSWCFVCLIVVTSAGCSDEGPRRYPISGTITFDGKPAAFGNISFDPVATGSGGGFAHVSDGKFNTDEHGRGHLGGMHHVQIVGFSGLANPSNLDSPGIPMFEPYEFDVDLPKKASSMDFEVPLSQALKPGRTKGGAK